MGDLFFFSYFNKTARCHGALIRNLIRLKGTAKITAQGEQVCLKDSKYILFEILEKKDMEGQYKLLPAEPAKLSNQAWSVGRSLYGPFMSYFLGFQTKYIWNPWSISVHHAQLVFLYLSTLLHSWLAHCDAFWSCKCNHVLVGIFHPVCRGGHHSIFSEGAKWVKNRISTPQYLVKN